MRAEIRETFAERSVLFKELTLAEIRQWLALVTADAAAAATTENAGFSASTVDVATSQLFEDFDVADLVMLTDLVDDDLGDFTPAELAAIHARCKTVNARFFAMRERLVAIGQAAMEATPQASS